MNETERDREVDAAWRAASSDEPPPALDAAIRAEARRAVGAAPGGTRNKHWWYPLAAAATVAVLAIGIVQLTPPEQVAPTVVADQSIAPREAQNQPARQSGAEVGRLAASPPATPVAAPPPPVQAQADTSSKRRQAFGGDALERERAVAPASEALVKKQAAEVKEEAPARAKLAAPTPSKPDASAGATAGGVAAPAPPRIEPFPASAPPADARRDVYASAPQPAANAAPGAETAQASRPAAAAARLESRVATAKVASVDEAKAKDAGARSVEDWIKRIRDLKNEGRVEDAAKELAAFRAAFGERADALLPPDLRAMTPPAPK